MFVFAYNSPAGSRKSSFGTSVDAETIKLVDIGEFKIKVEQVRYILF